MAYIKKAWQEKLQKSLPDKVVILEKRYPDMSAGTRMYIANPKIVDTFIRSIPFGKQTSLRQMRKDLAAQHNADDTCPLTSGIFLRIVAEAAYEDYTAGKAITEITPFWRALDSETPLLKKLSFGAAFIREQRDKEGLAF